MKRILMTGAMLLAAAGPANAGYFVAATAGASEFAGDIFSSYGYNFVLNPLNPSPTAGPQSATSSCVGSSFSCSNTGSVAPSTSSTTLTAVTVTAQSSATGAAEFGVPPYTVSSSAKALANLKTGSVGLAGSGTVEPYNNANGGLGTGQAVAVDTLHFTIAGALPSTVTDIPVAFRTTGTINPSTAEGGGEAGVRSEWLMNGAFLLVDMVQGNGGDAPVDSVFASPGGLTSGWVTAGVVPGSTPSDYTMSAVYAVTGASADIPVELYMSERCGFGSSCDYSQTGAISFDLPAGVSFTSDSGVFLTAQAVPEPGTLAILTGAIGLLWAAGGRRASHADRAGRRGGATFRA